MRGIEALLEIRDHIILIFHYLLLKITDLSYENEFFLFL